MLTYIIASIVVAYLLGSIPTSVWIGKIFYGVDVRDEGSHNAGTTNTIRVLGYKAGIPVFIIDVLKGWAAIWITRDLSGLFSETTPDWLPVVSAAAAVIGHVYPVFAGFRGGKGVATLLGIGLGLFPYAALTAFGVFFVVLLLFGYVSLGSILAGISFPFIVNFIFPPSSIIYVLLSIAVAIFMPLTHVSNIKRLLNGTENKFLWKKK